MSMEPETDREKYGFGEYGVTELSHWTIPLADGIVLAARLCIPDTPDANQKFSEQFSAFNGAPYSRTLITSAKQTHPSERFPVIMEYLPYYKDYYTASRDHNRHPWFASHGFVSMRLEMRGSGASEGFYYGEYLKKEQSDCKEVLDYITQQLWSNGNVGMYGKSWGGFNGLQMGYILPDDSPLKTAISLYSTDNRYVEDIHYEGGCVIGGGMLFWAARMFAWNARPPPPRYFALREAWLAAWLQRLELSGKSWLTSWLQHQKIDDSYWKQGSIDEDYSRVRIPILAIGALEDGYTNAASRMGRFLNPESRVLVGPWCHDWPDVSTAGPLIDYLSLCLAWFSYHLKGAHAIPEDPCTAWPRFQLFVRNSFKPQDIYNLSKENTDRLGQFVEFDDWISRAHETYRSFDRKIGSESLLIDSMESPDEQDESVKELYFVSSGSHNTLTSDQPPDDSAAEPVLVYSHPLQGAYCGVWSPFGQPHGYPGDQAISIANSLTFVSESLNGPLAMVGAGRCLIKLSCNSWARVYISVRVSDVDEDGAAGLLTRCQYDLNTLTPLQTDGDTRFYSLPMNFASHVFLAGHKIAISISPNAYPMMWPTSQPCELHMYPKDSRYLYQTAALDYMSQHTVNFDPPKPLLSIPKVIQEEPNDHDVGVEINQDTQGGVEYVYKDDTGCETLPTLGVTHQEVTREVYKVDREVLKPQASVSKRLTFHFKELPWGKEECVVTTHQSMEGDSEVYRTEEELTVEVGKETIFKKKWQDVIPRHDL